MTALPDKKTKFGKYVLEERIGRGGFADIFRATHQGPDGFTKQVAIKRIFPHLAEDAEFAGMFVQEAKLSSQLVHPHIVRIEEFGSVDGMIYIAMEYVGGRDLSQALHRFQILERGMSPALAAYIISCVASALHYAHQRIDPAGRPLNIIHRDVTPQNILLSWQGDVKLADFGIAKAATSKVKTRTGALKGKFAYMAPEQLDHRADHRSDIYSAGVILWELLAGQRLFTGETDWQILQRVARGDIPPIVDFAEVPSTIPPILERALHREGDKRFQTAEELAQALRACVFETNHLSGDEELAALLEELYVEDTLVNKVEMPDHVQGQIRRIAIKPKRMQQGSLSFRGLELISDQDNKKIIIIFSDALGPDLFDFPLFCWEGAHLAATRIKFNKQKEDGSLVYDATAEADFILNRDHYSAEKQAQSLWEKVAIAAEIEAMILAIGGTVTHSEAE